MAPTSDITALLDEWGRGDRRALDDLLPLVYAGLRRNSSFFPQKTHIFQEIFIFSGNFNESAPA